MESQFSRKFPIPKWSLYALLSFFIFLSEAPSSLTQQKAPVQTEKLDAARSVKTLFHFIKFRQPVSQSSFLPETRFSRSLLHYSNSIEVSFKNRADLVLPFAPIGINLIANFLPRSEEESLFSNRG